MTHYEVAHLAQTVSWSHRERLNSVEAVARELCIVKPALRVELVRLHKAVFPAICC